MLFFDELDAFTPKREVAGHHYSAEVNEFLSRLNNCSEQNVLVIGATNYIDRLDEAVTRAGRMHLHYFVGLPDLCCPLRTVPAAPEEPTMRSPGLGSPRKVQHWLHPGRYCSACNTGGKAGLRGKDSNQPFSFASSDEGTPASRSNRLPTDWVSSLITAVLAAKSRSSRPEGRE